MTDNVTFNGTSNSPTANTVVATDYVGTGGGGSAHFQRMKLDIGPDGTTIPLGWGGTGMPLGTLPGGSVGLVGTVEGLGTYQPLAGSVHLASGLPGTVQVLGSVRVLDGGTVQVHGTAQALGTVQPLAGSVHLASSLPGTVQVLGSVRILDPAAVSQSGAWAVSVTGTAQVLGSVRSVGTTEALGTFQPLAGSVHLASGLPGTVQVLGSVQTVGTSQVLGTVRALVDSLSQGTIPGGTVVVQPLPTAAGTYIVARLTDGANFYTASGGGGGASATDQAVFQAGITTVAPMAAVATITAIGQGSVGLVAMDVDRVLYVRGAGGTFSGTVQTHGTSQALGTVQPLAGSVHLASGLPGTVQVLGSVQIHGTAHVLGTVQTHGTTEILGTVRALLDAGTVQALGSVSVQGWDAHDAPVTGRPVLLGAFGSLGTPTAVANQDVVRLWADLNGRLNIIGTVLAVGSGTVGVLTPGGTVRGTVQVHGTAQALGTVQTHGTSHVLGSVGAQGYVAHGVAAAGNPVLLAAFGSVGTPTAVADQAAVRLWADLNGRLNIIGTVTATPTGTTQVLGSVQPVGTVQVLGSVQTHGTSQALGTFQPHGTVQALGTVRALIDAGTAQVLGSVQPVGTVQALGTIRTLPPSGTASGETYFSTIATGALAAVTFIAAPSAGTFLRIYDILISGSAAGTARITENAAGTPIGHLHVAANGGWSFNSTRGIRTRGTARPILFDCSAGTWGVLINYAVET